jgi:hypothetical protein
MQSTIGYMSFRDTFAHWDSNMYGAGAVGGYRAVQCVPSAGKERKENDLPFFQMPRKKRCRRRQGPIVNI